MLILYMLLLVSLLFWYWWKNFASAPCKNFPPGPIGLPILGYLPLLTENNLLTALDKIHDKYGDVVSVNMGPSKKMVFIGDYYLLKEAFKDDKGCGRPLDAMWLSEEFRHGNGTDSRGLAFSVVSKQNILFQNLGS